MANSNNAINNTIGASISGVTNTLNITNSSNTASSSARKKISVGGSSASDPSIDFNISGTTDWSLGIDNSDSDNFKLSQSNSLGSNDTIVCTQNGEVLFPRNPAFLAYVSSNIPNVTGDGTRYTVIFDTEDFDIGANYNNSTGVFTAPVEGIYKFCTGVEAYNLSVGIVGVQVDILIDGVYSRVMQANGSSRDVNDRIAGAGSVVYHMSAGSTAEINFQANSAGLTVGIYGDLATYPNNRFAWFSGFLVG